jgi:methylenetetrahydrofolate dehydrogenase (NADP+) / methenyltetrahydrofolate cyclohydrolase
VIQARANVAAQIIDGKAVARQVEEEVGAEVRVLGYQPGLTAVRVGNDPASEIYVRSKAKKAEAGAARRSADLSGDVLRGGAASRGAAAEWG